MLPPANEKERILYGIHTQLRQNGKQKPKHVPQLVAGNAAVSFRHRWITEWNYISNWSRPMIDPFGIHIYSIHRHKNSDDIV